MDGQGKCAICIYTHSGKLSDITKSKVMLFVRRWMEIVMLSKLSHVQIDKFTYFIFFMVPRFYIENIESSMFVWHGNEQICLGKPRKVICQKGV